MNANSPAVPQSDAHLWLAVTQGDTGAFQTVVERYQSLVSAVAYAIVGDFALSQDVAQETFWTAWKSRQSLRQPRQLASWLCGIARNLASQSRRRQQRTASAAPLHADDVAAASDPEAETISAEQRDLVWHSLEELPETYREALVLFYRQEQSVAQVAAALDLSEDAVKQRLSRGRTMLRDQLATLVEDVLVRTRPGRQFTSRVMAGIVGTLAALKQAGAASAATIAGKSAGQAVLGASSAGAMAGAAGGLAGAAGGLGGAWLGTWLPAQLAPTMAERRLLEASGRRLMRAAIVYTLLLLALAGLLFVPRGMTWYFVSVGLTTVVFISYVIAVTVSAQQQVVAIRQSPEAQDEPNLSALRTYMMVSATQPRWRGRSYTSQGRFLGRPWIDVQVSDPMPGCPGQPRMTARGWIAIGDRADGILFAFGGLARGLIAVGGLSLGLISLGGLSVGVLSLGGLAVGGLGMGGCAVSYWAVGGVAAGWDAAGGAALGWHSAVGGLAVARYAAFGGLAVARDYAVGGQAIAREANTEAARHLLATDSLKWMMDWYMQHQFLFLVVFLAVAALPTICLPLLYRRTPDVPDPES